MSRAVLLDTGPLGKVSNPKASPDNQRCKAWMEALRAGGVLIKVPGIADYELRRELIRANKQPGIERLNAIIAETAYLPMTREVMDKAAEFWALARQQGVQTADDRMIDGDMILCAHAAIELTTGDDVVIATTNVGHLSRFAPARQWDEIT